MISALSIMETGLKALCEATGLTLASRVKISAFQIVQNTRHAPLEQNQENTDFLENHFHKATKNKIITKYLEN